MGLATLIALGIVAALVGGVVLFLRQQRGVSRGDNERAKELQTFLTARVEDLRQVLAKDRLSTDAKRAEAYAILAQMESRNTAGDLDAFIQDNREAVDAALIAAARSN